MLQLAALFTTVAATAGPPPPPPPPVGRAPAPAAALPPLQFFVDCEHGDDGADGRSAQRPFLTIARAQNATRSAAGAATVYLAPGVCQLVGNGSMVSAAAELYRPWVVSAADSGTSFEALDSAAPPPVISAGIRLTGTWTRAALHGGRVWSTTVPGTAPIGKQLFWARGSGQPEQRQVLARAPNRPVVLRCGAASEGCAPPYLEWQQTIGHWLPTKTAPAWNSTMPVGLQWDASDDALFASLVGHEGTVHVGVSHSWSFSKHGIAAIQRNRTVLFSQGPAPDMWKVGTRYYLENALPLLDAEGEWFGDNATRRLYY